MFATIRTKQGLRMSVYDIMHAVCPFNYSTKSVEDLKVISTTKHRSMSERTPQKRWCRPSILMDLDDSVSMSSICSGSFMKVICLSKLASIPQMISSFGGMEEEEDSFNVGSPSDIKNKTIILQRKIERDDLRKFMRQRSQDAKVMLLDTNLPVFYL